MPSVGEVLAARRGTPTQTVHPSHLQALRTLSRLYAEEEPTCPTN